MAQVATFPVDVPGTTTITARHYPAARDARLRATLGLAHGAGAGQASAFMVNIATGLSGAGLDVVTFDFPYIERGRHLPDPRATLEAAWLAVIDAAAARRPLSSQPLLIGGKSMGGRIASQVAALAGPATKRIAGLVFLGYPLHPPGRPEQRRDAHLPAITAPMLFVQGERDTFGTAEEMRALVATLDRADLHIVEGADHSLARPKREGGSAADLERVRDTVVEWITRVVLASPVAR